MSLIEVLEGYCNLRSTDGKVTLEGLPLAQAEEATASWARVGIVLEVTKQYSRRVLLEGDCLHSVQMSSADGKIVLDDVDVNDIVAVSEEYERKGTPLNITQWHSLADVAKRKKETD